MRTGFALRMDAPMARSRSERENLRTGLLKRLACCGLIAAALAACEPVSSGSGAIQIDPAVQPGAQRVSLVEATGFFQRTCLQHAPDFAGSTAELGAPLFRQSSTTGTYFHQNLNMSFKLIPDSSGTLCSMVFASSVDPTQLTIAFGAMSSSDGNVDLDPVSNRAQTRGPNGTVMTFRPTPQQGYYNVVLGKPN